MCPKITSQTLSYPPASPLPLKKKTTIESIVLYDFRWFWLWWPSKYIIPFGEHLKQSKPQLTTYPLCHQEIQQWKIQRKNHREISISKTCAQLQNINYKWNEFMFIMASLTKMYCLVHTIWCLNYHCIQWQLNLNLLSNQMNIN